MDPNVLTAVLANMGNMMDPASLATLNYLNQMGGMGGYQDIIRQYQNNLSTITSMAGSMNPISSSVSSMSNVSTMSTASSSVNTNSNLGQLGHLGNLGNMGNLGSLVGNLGNLGNLNNLGGLTMQQYLGLSSCTATGARSTPTYHQTTAKAMTTTTTTSMTKEKPSISITPVNSSSSTHAKPSNKSSKVSSSSNDPNLGHSSKTNQISQATKAAAHSSAAQVSLLKPSVIQQVKSMPPKQMSAPLIRVSKTLTEPQPAHKSSLSHSPVLKSNSSTSPSSIPQAAHSGISSSLGMKPPIQLNLPSQGSGTSLQHKLLSKKQHQPPHMAAGLVCPPKKQKTSKKVSSIASSAATYQNLLNMSNISNSSGMSQPTYLPAELSGISLSQLPPLGGSKPSKGSGYRKTSSKSKHSAADVVGGSSAMSNPLFPSRAVEAMSVLSQLQQHSHLEIIPQHKNQTKSGGIDFPMNLPSSLSVTQQKVNPVEREPANRMPVSDSMSVYELTRGKSINTSSSNTSKKSEKLKKDGVEIITLDD